MHNNQTMKDKYIVDMEQELFNLENRVIAKEKTLALLYTENDSEYDEYRLDGEPSESVLLEGIKKGKKRVEKMKSIIKWEINWFDNIKKNNKLKSENTPPPQHQPSYDVYDSDSDDIKEIPPSPLSDDDDNTQQKNIIFIFKGYESKRFSPFFII